MYLSADPSPPMSTSRPPDVIHVIGVPRRSLFFPLFRFRVLYWTQTEEQKNGGGLGTTLSNNYTSMSAERCQGHLALHFEASILHGQYPSHGRAAQLHRRSIRVAWKLFDFHVYHKVCAMIVWVCHYKCVQLDTHTFSILAIPSKLLYPVFKGRWTINMHH